MIFARKKSKDMNFIEIIFLESMKCFRHISTQSHPKAIKTNEWTYRTVIYAPGCPEG